MLTNLFNNLKFALDYIFDWFNLSVNFEINTNCVIFFILNFFVILVFPYFFKISFLFKIKICIKKLICKSWFCIKFMCVFLVKLIVRFYSLCTKKIKTYLLILIVSSLFYDFLNCIITLINIAKFRCSAKKPKYFDYAPIDLIDEYGDITDKCRRGGNDYSDKSNLYTEQFEELKSFLENRNVKNLAVFGSYGAGKSSFLKSFFTHYTVNGRRDEDNIIYISLPDFKYTKNDKIINQTHTKHNIVKDNERAINAKNQFEASEKDSHNINLETVETEIIRQLIHGKISKKIPVSLFSNFKTDTVEIITISVFILSFITSFFICKNHNIGIKEFFNIDNYLWLRLLLLLLFFYSIFKYFSKRFRFSNVSFFNVGVSAKYKSEESIFDLYLDEITYLFEESNCRYVVFEDLDRTENYEVLTHLRNLNFILNNDYRCIDNITGKQRRIVFIYVIRSDIFNIAQETVKFFDASIHVQNVITSANSWEFFIKYRDDLCKNFNKDEFKKEFLSSIALTDNFLSDIAKLISDLRLVKMIFNDYLNVLGSLEVVFSKNKNLKSDVFGKKIFSYSVFRSVYPVKYEELIKDIGPIFAYLNKKNIENKISIQPIINDENLSDKEKNLLEFLLVKQYLSEDYRLYGASFSIEKFKSEDNDIKFFSRLLNSSNEICTDLEISKYIAEVILQYFPNSVFYCYSVFNKFFFNSLLTRANLTKVNTSSKILEKYMVVLIELLRKQYHQIIATFDVSTFIVGLCDFIRIRYSDSTVNDSEKIHLWLQLFLVKLSDSYNLPKRQLPEKNSSEKNQLLINCHISDFMKDNIIKFIAYMLNYFSVEFKEIDEEGLFKSTTINSLIRWTVKDFIYNDNNNVYSEDMQCFLANNLSFVTDNLFCSLEYLNYQFKFISPKLSLKNSLHLHFIKQLINRRYKQEYPVKFFFKENWNNFEQISKFLSEIFADASMNLSYSMQDCDKNSIELSQIHKLHFFTILFNIKDKSIIGFDETFFSFLFITEHYDNLLRIFLDDNWNPVNIELYDNENIIFFIILMMNLSYIRNGTESHYEKFASKITSDIHLKSIIENYQGKNLFENIIYFFLDKENKHVENLESVIKETISFDFKECHLDLSDKNILFTKWQDIFNFYDFRDSINCYKAIISSISLILDYSCLADKKIILTSSIYNIIFIREIISEREENNFIAFIRNQETNSVRNICWKSLSQFFYKYYKEIFASDKDNLYNLSPDFDEQPYSFKTTKQCISSLKKKE